MLRFGNTYVMTRHVVSVALSGDFLEVRTTAGTEQDAPIARFELRQGDQDEDMDAISTIVASNSSLSGVTNLTDFLA